MPGYADTGRQVVLYYINPCPTMAEPPLDQLAAQPLRCSAAIGINEIYPELKRRIETVLSSDRIPFSGTHFEFETCSTGNAALGAMSGGEIANLDVEKSLAVHGWRKPSPTCTRSRWDCSRTSNTSSCEPAARAAWGAC